MTTNDNGKAMTLEQVSHMLRCASEDVVNPRYRTKFTAAADAIDAHLATRVTVTNEDVDRFQDIYNEAWDKAVADDPGSTKGTADQKATKVALESFAVSLGSKP